MNIKLKVSMVDAENIHHAFMNLGAARHIDLADRIRKQIDKAKTRAERKAKRREEGRRFMEEVRQAAMDCFHEALAKEGGTIQKEGDWTPTYWHGKQDGMIKHITLNESPELARRVQDDQGHRFNAWIKQDYKKRSNTSLAALMVVYGTRKQS